MPSDHKVEVIGAAWGRTGTFSLKAALEILGYPTYHMFENVNHSHCAFWLRVARGDKYDFNECFDLADRKYTATVDFPAAVYWLEQRARYPQAKVILTVRDPERWYSSFSQTILTVISAWEGCHWSVRVGLWLGLPVPGFDEMHDLVVVQQAFGGDLSKDGLIERFKQHIQAVQAEVPADQLLVFNVSQGWEPLCAFLDKPIPSVPFPNCNDVQEFHSKARFIGLAGYLAVALLLALPVVAGIAYQQGLFHGHT